MWDSSPSLHLKDLRVSVHGCGIANIARVVNGLSLMVFIVLAVFLLSLQKSLG